MTDLFDAALCCDGACRRKQPIKLSRGGLSGRWYVVTRWKDRGDGMIEAVEKHEPDADSQQMLAEMYDAWIESQP